MSGFEIVRPQEIGASKLRDELSRGGLHRSRKDEVGQSPFRVQLMERSGGRPVSTSRRSPRTGVRTTTGIEVGREAVGQHMVLLRAFLSDESRQGLAKPRLVSPSARSDEIEQQIGAGHL